MTFDAWIDAVDAGVRSRLGREVHTEELSNESALWVGPRGSVVAELGNDGDTASISSGGASRSTFAFRELEPETAIERVVARLR